MIPRAVLFKHGRHLLDGVPVVPLTLGRGRGRNFAAIVDTGASDCMVPDTYLIEEGYDVFGAPRFEISTANGNTWLPRVDVECHVFGAWRNVPFLAPRGGPVLIGRRLLDEATDVIGYLGRFDALFWTL